MPRRLHLVVALLAALLSCSPAALAAPFAAAPVLTNSGADSISAPGPVVASDTLPARDLAPRWIVELADPPLAQYRQGEYSIQQLRPAGRLDLAGTAAQQYVAQLEQRQTQVFAAVQATFPQAQLQRRYQVVFNGLALALPGAGEVAAERLRSLPGVAAVYQDRAYAPTMYASVPQIGADKLWRSDQIGGVDRAGEGLKIAVIDSGIKVANPFFSPNGFSYPEGFPKGDSAHTTPKVIVARAYFRPDAPPAPGSETPEPGPDDSSHGTHTAGSAAGVANTKVMIAGIERTISGVAPRAYLLNYKTFYTNDTVFSGQAFDVELIAAIEDAVKDGADVINNSYGGRAEARPGAYALARAAEAASDAGVVMVFSAGNEGPDASTAGAPAYSDKVISVGASSTNQSIGAGFVDVVAPEGAPDSLKARPFGRAAFGRSIGIDLIGPVPYLPVATISDSTLACAPLPAGSLTGKIALIERGSCGFSQKVLNAQQADAAAAIIYNSAEGGEQLIGMAAGPGADQVTIPAVSVARSVGLGMTDWYAQHGEAAQVQIDGRARVVDQTADVLAGFSSRGPSFQVSLKPDVVAPGVSILSSGFGLGSGGEQHLGFGLVSGTSMAGPHVAGAAALLLQAPPEWTPAEVKSALMSTATTTVWLDPAGTQPASVLDRGAGRINVDRAATVELLFDRPALSFGALAASAGQPTRGALNVTARNVSGTGQTFSLATQASDGAAVSVTPATLTLAAGESAQLSVAIEIPADAPAGDYEGQVVLDGGPQPLHLPLWARALPAEQAAKVLLLDNDGSSSQGLPDYAGYYGNLLSEQSVSFQHLDVDVLKGQAQTLPTLPELQRYEIVLWFTGDNATPSGSQPLGVAPLTETDQNLLIAYLQGGGNLIASGQDLTAASDVNSDPPNDPRYGRSDLYQSYLGARFVQDDVFSGTASLERKLVGAETQPWLAGLTLDLAALGEGVQPGEASSAGNQRSVDAVTVIDIDPRTPDQYTRPILRVAGLEGNPVVGLNRTGEPSLEQPEPGIPYRSTYLAFGLEGVRGDTSTTTRKQLLQQILYWTVDRPSVTLSLPDSAEVGQEVTLSAAAQSNTPASFTRYRWNFGDGTPVVETAEPTVSHSYSIAGSYQPRVEVTDSWEHRAIGGGSVRVRGGVGTGSLGGGNVRVRGGADAGLLAAPLRAL